MYEIDIQTQTLYAGLLELMQINPSMPAINMQHEALKECFLWFHFPLREK